jgi:hypothetical protein
MRRSHVNLFIGLSMGSLALLAAVRPLLPSEPGPHGPRTLQEAIAAAEALGLCWGTDECGGVPYARVVVSEFPVTWERACGVVLDPARPCWVGTVAIWPKGRQLVPMHDPARCALWGDLFVYGDPELIARLTGLRPLGPASIE